MNSEASQLAPLPDHGNTDDRVWQAMWSAYEPVITPLRRMGLVTDVELGGRMYGITAELNDGSYLLITSEYQLPADPAEVEGWHVQRIKDDVATIQEIVYDSTEIGEQAHHGNEHLPLFDAITTFVKQRALGVRFKPLKAVSITGLQSDHSTIEPVTDFFPKPEDAIARYGREVAELRSMGWRCLHQQGGNDWPLSVWAGDGGVVTVAVALVGQTPE
ncbi:hypothetical protein ABZX75_01130 [Streptomyces sp. NPDC003038]|uniref:hypothetical protein n=1 Tax=unclassified Streptomyces TaxID=2593676 RepID=UPI0033A16A5B